MKELREEILEKHAAIYPDDSVYTTKQDIELMMEEYKNLCHAQGSASGFTASDMEDSFEYGANALYYCKDQRGNVDMTEYERRKSQWAAKWGIDFKTDLPLPPGEKEKDSHAQKTETITDDSMTVNLHDWVNRIIEGSTGFKTWEDRECVIHHVSREYSIAAFVIRCLANKDCEGSDAVLEAIKNRRDKLSPERSQENKDKPGFEDDNDANQSLRYQDTD